MYKNMKIETTII